MSGVPGYLRLGDAAPDFDADSTIGAFNLYKFKEGSWLVLFSHPGDYTPVCTTELGLTAKLVPDLAKRNTKAAAISVDTVEDHHGWVKDIEETQSCTVNYPIIADPDRRIAELYGMLAPNSPMTMAGKLTVRSVFIIDPANKIRLILTYPAATGRNFNEIIRVLDGLQLTDEHKVATPGNWQQGEDVVILPTISNEDAKGLFPEGWKELKPYLRLVSQPGAGKKE
eukprot:TRINITY_DN279_c0_g1_i1.p2 TRINITY_DN279_c0_g1~~TRINITY_DN279_c0_g1_i1.p2  ORF type:complete len:225 (+),score=44.82 TRINITY_DN279_c0_g1_i1:49-723(+)